MSVHATVYRLLTEASATHAWDMSHEAIMQILFAPPEQIEDDLYDQHQTLLRDLFPEYVADNMWDGEQHQPIQDLVDRSFHYGGEEAHQALADFLKQRPDILAAHHWRVVDEYGDEYGMSTAQMKAARTVPDERAPDLMALGIHVIQKLQNDQDPDEDDFEAGGDPFEVAKAQFGVTHSLQDAFYLLPDGDMLSGGGGGGGRAFDHRNIGYGQGGTAGMQEFMSLGAIRLMPEDGSLDIMIAPTSAQYRVLEEWIDHYSFEGMPVDLEDGLGDFDERDGYYLKAARRESHMFDPQENPRKIMGVITRFYTGQEESLTEEDWTDYGHGPTGIAWALIDGRLVTQEDREYLDSERSGDSANFHMWATEEKRANFHGRYDPEQKIITLASARSFYTDRPQREFKLGRIAAMLKAKWPGNLVLYFPISDRPQLVEDSRLIIRRMLTETSREEFVQRGEDVCSRHSYINCKLFVQLASGHAKLEDLPETSDPKPGDIVAWPPRHYAIYLGGDNVMHIGEWGADFEEASLQQLISEYDEPLFLSVPQ